MFAKKPGLSLHKRFLPGELPDSFIVGAFRVGFRAIFTGRIRSSRTGTFAGSALIIYIKTGTFENNPGAAENNPADFLSALGTDLQGFILHALESIKTMTAGFTFIFIGGHFRFLITYLWVSFKPRRVQKLALLGFFYFLKIYKNKIFIQIQGHGFKTETASYNKTGPGTGKLAAMIAAELWYCLIKIYRQHIEK